LEDRYTHREFDFFLGAGGGDSLEKNILVDKIIKDRLILFWKIIA